MFNIKYYFFSSKLFRLYIDNRYIYIFFNHNHRMHNYMHSNKCRSIFNPESSNLKTKFILGEDLNRYIIELFHQTIDGLIHGS